MPDFHKLLEGLALAALLVFVIFLAVLKLCGVLLLPWSWVFAALWLPVTIFFLSRGITR